MKETEEEGEIVEEGQISTTSLGTLNADSNVISQQTYASYEFVFPGESMISSTFSIESKKLLHNFSKSTKWSPDGSCLLTNSEDNILRLYEWYQISQY